VNAGSRHSKGASGASQAMCIVCGPGGTRLLRSTASQYAPAKPASRSRFVAEEVVPTFTPALDPTNLEDLKGQADVILRGGPILTLRARDEVAPAIAVRAGRIQAVGDEEFVLALRGRLTRMIDLDGRALVPGFVLADWHPPLSLLCDWLEAAETPTEVIAAAVAEPSGEWLALMVDGSAEDWAKAAVVATASRPAVTVDQKGSILAASSAAQALVPELDHQRFDQASTQAQPHVSTLLPTFLGRLAGSRRHLRVRLSALLREAARRGVTTLRFCGLGSLAGHEDPDLVRSAAGESPLLRLRGAVDTSLALHSDLERLYPGSGDDLFRIDTAAHWIDASTNSRELAEVVRALRERGWRVTLHAESPAGIDLALNAFSAAARLGASFDVSDGLERRDAKLAGTWARIRRLGVSAGITLEDPSVTGDGAPRLRAPRDIPMSLTRDLMAGAPNPLTILSAAAEAKVAEGADVADWLPSVTADASARCGTRAILGSFEVGKYADFAFLDRDPRTVDLRSATQIECKATWLAGREIRC
jgi:predicted amidohydrolase YtcJ